MRSNASETPRERFLAALRRERGDYVPMSLQFTPTTLAAFRASIGDALGTADPYEHYKLDYRHVPVRLPRTLPDFRPYFEGRVPGWASYGDGMAKADTYRGSSYFIMGAPRCALNEWGEYRVFEESGDYHEKIYPLGGREATVEDIDAFPLPDLTEAYRYEGIGDAIDAVHARGLAAVLPWEMTIFEKAWRIRGIEELLTDLYLQPEVADRLFDRIAERSGYLARRYAELGVDIIQLGDDIGSQQAMMISPGMYRRFLKPRMASIIAGIKEANPDTLIFYHCDGVVDEVVEDFVEIGIDILNPVQRECMDIGALKRRFGPRLSFWGGLSVQRTLPFGSPEAVAAETREIIELAGEGGGLVIAPGHLIERDIPMANVEAFVQAVTGANEARLSIKETAARRSR